MKKIYMMILALLFVIPMFAQEKAPEGTDDDTVYVWCVMPNKKGYWLPLSTPTESEVADFQEKLIYLKLLKPTDISEKGTLDRATSDAILKLESIKGVTYGSKEIVGFTQGMKNRLTLMYHTAKRAEERKKKQ